MKSFFRSLSFAFLLAAASLAGCTRIATGEAGVRIDMNNTTQQAVLREGSWNQTLFGNVLTFPVREVGLSLQKRTPLTVENTPLGEFDALITYNIHPDAVPVLWSQHSRSFHTYHEDSKEYHLMESYLMTMADNSVLRAIRKYKQLEVNDNRQQIEAEIMSSLKADLKSEHLDNVVTFNTIQVQKMLPNHEILQSALNVVKTQNDLKVKQNEVLIAQQEAARMSALASQGAQSIAYMNAQANLNISEGVKNGKVGTIIVPGNFTSYGNVGK